jgi:type IV secretion system protein VirD4
MLYAPTRTGKGVGVVIPNLLTWPQSLVVLDIKGENWAASAGSRAAHGQRVLLFDPLSPA